MDRKRITLLSWIAIGIAGYAAAFVGGYYVSCMRAEVEIGHRALGTLMDELSALGYLEKGDLDGVRHMLRISLDSQVITVHRFGTPEFDKGMPDARKKWFLNYEAIRKKYPAIDYKDGGAMNREVDRAFDAVRRSQ